MSATKKQPLKLATPPKANGNGNGCHAFDMCQPRFQGIEESLKRVELLVRSLYRDAGGNPDEVAAD